MRVAVRRHTYEQWTGSVTSKLGGKSRGNETNYGERKNEGTKKRCLRWRVQGEVWSLTRTRNPRKTKEEMVTMGGSGWFRKKDGPREGEPGEQCLVGGRPEESKSLKKGHWWGNRQRPRNRGQ